MKVWLLLTLMGTTIQICAQQKCRGIILEANTSIPIAFATITIHQSDRLIRGLNADEQGEFEFSEEEFDFLEVSAVGFTTMKVDFDEFRDKNLVQIELSREIQLLEEVVLIEDKNRTTFSNTKKVFNLGADLQKSGMSGIEVFELVPEVQTNFSNGTISLRGSDNVSVFINGQPTALTPYEAIQQLPASRIAKVEIITSPSAKYRSEGISGIINVVLLKNRNAGLNLNAETSVGTRRYGAAVNGNYAFNKFNFRWNSSYNSTRKLSFQDIERDFLLDDARENITSLYVLDGDVLRFGGGVDFTFNERHQFSISSEYSDDSHTNNIDSHFFDLENRDDFRLFRENTHEHFVFNLNPNYRLNLDENQFVELDFNLDVSTNEYPLTDFEEGIAVNGQILDEDFELRSFSIDYHRPLGNSLVVDTGVFRYTQDLTSRQEITVPADQFEPLRFKYSEEIMGGYAEIKASLNKIGINLGLRYEDFSSTSFSNELSVSVNQDFKNLFPTAHLTYDLSETSKMAWGFSRRISRPNFHHVNALQIVNPLFLWEYNPNIIPETSNNFDFNYNHFGKKATINFNISYRNRMNTILWVESSDGENQIFRYENSGQFNTVGLEGSLKYALASYWQAQFSGNVYLTQIEESDRVTNDNLYASRLQLRNSFTITKNITSNLMYYLWPQNRGAFNETDTRQRIDFALRWKFHNDRFRLNLRVVDIFDANKIQRNSSTQNLNQFTEWDIQDITRNFLLSMSYDLFKGKEFKTERLKRKYNEIPID